MGNDYKKGHAYRMKTDANYRARHIGTFKAPQSTASHTCSCGSVASEYHHIDRRHGRWVCKTCHKRIHGGQPRGKTPYS